MNNIYAQSTVKLAFIRPVLEIGKISLTNKLILYPYNYYFNSLILIQRVSLVKTIFQDFPAKIKLTSSVSVDQIGKPPDIAKPHHIAQTG